MSPPPFLSLPCRPRSSSDILDVYPTTALQTSFLLAGLMVPNAYIMAVPWDLSPNTDTLKLQEAFSHFIDHPNGIMLRTMFLLEPSADRWLQMLLKPGRKQMKWKTINVANEAALELGVSEYQQNQAIESFNAGDLLTRACIFEVNGRARVLIWTLHHGLMDGWSLENMIFDIERIYLGRPFSHRRPFKIMIRYLHQVDHGEGVEFWRKHLLNASPTPFPQRRPNLYRGAADDVLFRNFHIHHGPLTRRFGIMPSALMICAWSIVLSKHSGTTDIVFGQVPSGRSL